MTAPLRIRELRLPTGQSIDLTVEAGQIHCVSGDSGVGKSRFLRALADLDSCPGTVMLGSVERSTVDPAKWRRQVMLVPAVSRWWLHSLRAHLHGDIGDLATQLGLGDDRLDAPVSELSTGELARGALLRALALEPAVLMLDEPTGALDDTSRDRVERMLHDYASSHALIWVTHDRAQARRLGTHLWRLTPDELEEEAR